MGFLDMIGGGAGATGIGMGLLGAGIDMFMTSNAADKARARMNKAMGMVDEGETRQMSALGKGQRRLAGAERVARQSAQASKRESLAATQAAQSMMDRNFAQQMAQASAAAGARGLTGTTAGMAGMGASMGGIANAIAQMQMQGAQANIGINQQLTGTLANIAGQSAGMFGQEAGIIGQNAAAKANMLAGFSEPQSNALAGLFSNVGGSILGTAQMKTLGPEFFGGKA